MTDRTSNAPAVGPATNRRRRGRRCRAEAHRKVVVGLVRAESDASRSWGKSRAGRAAGMNQTYTKGEGNWPRKRAQAHGFERRAVRRRLLCVTLQRVGSQRDADAEGERRQYHPLQ